MITVLLTKKTQYMVQSKQAQVQRFFVAVCSGALTYKLHSIRKYLSKWR